MTRRSTERKARQKFVVDAARRLFETKGLEYTSMENIAAASDYTRRTLYAYFKSRDEIFLLVLIEDLVARWAKQKIAVAAADTGLAKLLAWGESFYDYARENPHSLPLQLYWDLKGVDRERIGKEVFADFEKINNELAEGLRAIFHCGVEDKSLRPDLNIDLCISQFLYSLRSVLNRALSPTYSFAVFDPDEYVKHFFDLFTRAIRNTGGTRS